MEEMTDTEKSYEAYRRYLAMKMHFTNPTYSFHKTHGLAKASIKAFQKRKDKYFFYKLSHIPDYMEHMLAHFVKNPKTWVKTIVDDKSVHEEWKGRMRRAQYLFEEELNLIPDGIVAQFIVNKGQHPPALKLLLGGHVSLETMVYLDIVGNFTDHWMKEFKVVDDFTGVQTTQLILDYKPFMTVNVDNLKKSFRKRMNRNK